ncbi:hypothetical protein LI90_1418 [Carbonactinospora thermoautotrophica]|uniref:TIGR03086 family protein n=1 Tax=Carbonactinospora thermoautotrophica TaxID=1469144 RepID=A0A132MPY2_9ACTN|nr:hypothetical protein [Carbonactinospora thermoautotrophica]KWW99779.1 hypothetical protein LI90_1418 [Carbonactinospora thermoautotrophica]
MQALVDHLVTEQLWTPQLLGGKTTEEVGTSSGRTRSARGTPRRPGGVRAGVLDQLVHLSYGTVDAAEYCQEMISDLLVHAWDLARGIGADERLHPELVRLVYDQYAPRADELHQLGLFDAPVPVPDDADPQTTLIALFGRRP